MKILVTGATGVLGNYLVNFLKNKSYKIFSLGFKKKTENNLDLNNKEKLFIFLKEIKPEVIINCAAFTNVNECENNFIKAYTNNALIVNSLVSVLFSLKMRPHLIHFSSDQVYNQRGANSESNVKLSNNYSVAKYISEIEARYYNKATILRTNFYGKSHLSYRGSFSDYIISFLSKKKNIKLPVNIFFNPINLNILSTLVEKFIVKKKYGTFNIGSKKIISKFKFGKIISKNLGLDTKLIKKSRSKYAKDRRPLNTGVSVKKIEKVFNLKFQSIENEYLNKEIL